MVTKVQKLASKPVYLCMAKKHDLRELFRNKRSKLCSQELSEASIRIFNHIVADKLIEGNLVILYMSSHNLQELPTDALFSLSSNYDICVPKVINKNGIMEAVMWNKKTPTTTNEWGITEPQSDTYISPENIDTVVVPLMCFDKAGHRVGFGKGYYDRFLKRCSKDVKTVGVSYFEPVDKITDVETTDVALNVIVTPKKVYRF
jgi:5-formyltetrahydrofolate cyclo-ligase